jgi:hypothetical protein
MLGPVVNKWAFLLRLVRYERLTATNDDVPSLTAVQKCLVSTTFLFVRDQLPQSI